MVITWRVGGGDDDSGMICHKMQLNSLSMVHIKRIGELNFRVFIHKIIAVVSKTVALFYVSMSLL